MTVSGQVPEQAHTQLAKATSGFFENGPAREGFASAQEIFSAFSAKVEPAEYARRIDAIPNPHYADGRAEMLSVARKTATPAQR